MVNLGPIPYLSSCIFFIVMHLFFAVLGSSVKLFFSFPILHLPLLSCFPLPTFKSRHQFSFTPLFLVFLTFLYLSPFVPSFSFSCYTTGHLSYLPSSFLHQNDLLDHNFFPLLPFIHPSLSIFPPQPPSSSSSSRPSSSP